MDRSIRCAERLCIAFFDGWIAWPGAARCERKDVRLGRIACRGCVVTRGLAVGLAVRCVVRDDVCLGRIARLGRIVKRVLGPVSLGSIACLGREDV